MTKKNAGLAKTEVIRIHPKDRHYLNIMKSHLKMGSRYNEGDVVHELIKICNGKKTGTLPFLERSQSPKLSEGAIQNDEEFYKNLYENQCKISQQWVKITDKACEIGHLDKVEIIEMIVKENHAIIQT